MSFFAKEPVVNFKRIQAGAENGAGFVLGSLLAAGLYTLGSMAVDAIGDLFSDSATDEEREAWFAAHPEIPKEYGDAVPADVVLKWALARRAEAKAKAEADEKAKAESKDEPKAKAA